MADTPSTGNTTSTVDQAPPTDTAQSTGETVQLAAAAATVQVSAPARGAEASLTVEPFVESTYPGTGVGGKPASRLVLLP